MPAKLARRTPNRPQTLNMSVTIDLAGGEVDEDDQDDLGGEDDLDNQDHEDDLDDEDDCILYILRIKHEYFFYIKNYTF